MRKKSTYKQLSLIISVVLALLLGAYLITTPPTSDITIRLHDDQIDIQKFTNAVAEFIITEGYGYSVKKVESTIKEVHGHLINGDVDVTLELWKENNLVWYHNAIKAGAIEDLGVIYSGGRQYWIIPRWYAEEKNIKSVYDMRRHWRDFANPEDPSKGLFFNCIFGWACRDINKVKLKGYGLDRFYNTVAPISPEALKSIYESAQKRRLPVFGYYWEPNAIMTDQDWYILEEPEYSEAVWLQIIESAADPENTRIDQSCAYKNNSVHKIAHVNLQKKAPDIRAMLKHMEIDIRFFNLMLSDSGTEVRDDRFFSSLAREFLMKQPRVWHNWVGKKAQKKIEAALRLSAAADIRQ